MTIYRQIILEHAQNPKNQGHLKSPNSKAHVANPLCGDEITIEIERKGDNIKDIKFSGTGCIIMKASASLLTEKVKEIKDVNKIEKLGSSDLTKLLGGELTPSRQRCASLALEAIKEAIQN